MRSNFSEFLRLHEVPKRCEIPGRDGPVGVSTVWRWALRGVRGVRLRTLLVGGHRCTTADWVSDFVARLNADERVAEQPNAHRTPIQRQRSSHRASEELLKRWDDEVGHGAAKGGHRAAEG